MDNSKGNIIWLASYPKSGNTWFRAFYTNLMLDKDTPARIDELLPRGIASSRKLFDDYSGIEASDLTIDEIDRLRPRVYETMAREKNKTLFIKIHDAYTETDNGTALISRSATKGAIYFVRNPLDVAVSFAHHNVCSIDSMIKYMADEQYSFCGKPEKIYNQLRQKLHSWSTHITSWMDALGTDLHLMRYEDMVIDPVATFTGAVRFAQLPDEPQRIKKALDFSQFRELQTQEQTIGFKEKTRNSESFFRKGAIGSWRESLTESQVLRIINDHKDVMKRFGYLNSNDEPVY